MTIEHASRGHESGKNFSSLIAGATKRFMRPTATRKTINAKRYQKTPYAQETIILQHVLAQKLLWLGEVLHRFSLPSLWLELPQAGG